MLNGWCRWVIHPHPQSVRRSLAHAMIDNVVVVVVHWCDSSWAMVDGVDLAAWIELVTCAHPSRRRPGLRIGKVRRSTACSGHQLHQPLALVGNESVVLRRRQMLTQASGRWVAGGTVVCRTVEGSRRSYPRTHSRTQAFCRPWWKSSPHAGPAAWRGQYFVDDLSRLG